MVFAHLYKFAFSMHYGNMHQKIIKKSMDFQVEISENSFKNCFENSFIFGGRFFWDFEWIWDGFWEGLGSH